MQQIDCPFRSENHHCQLIEEIIDQHYVEIPTDYCQQCQKHNSEPTKDDPGPVVAGLVKHWAVAHDQDELVQMYQPHMIPKEPAEFRPKQMRDGCIHLGNFIRKGKTKDGQNRLCPACEVFGCDLYESCTRGTNNESIRSCITCPEYLHEDQEGTDCKIQLSFKELKQKIPLSPRRGYKVSNWKIGITTAPRKRTTLDRCIQSLLDSGWDQEDIFVFAEPDSRLPKFNVHVEQRSRQYGAWPNTYAAMVQMAAMHIRENDAVMILQDDALFPGGEVRQYLEEALWPDPSAVVSAYTAKHYTSDEPGWHIPTDHKGRKVGWKFWGAVAMIYSKSSLKRILKSQVLTQHLISGKANGLKNVDSVIGLAARKTRCPIYTPTPSVVQHIGETSTLYPKAGAKGRRHAIAYVGNKSNHS